MIFGVIIAIILSVVINIVFWIMIFKIVHWALGDTGCIIVVVIIGAPILGFALFLLYKYLGY